VTEADRALAALAAVFAPARARELLARLAAPGGGEPAALAAGLAAAPRAERLARLSAALAPGDASARADDEAVAAAERRPVAACVRLVAAGAPPPPGASPVLVRLCRERLRR
jgi:hypothetical protein